MKKTVIFLLSISRYQIVSITRRVWRLISSKNQIQLRLLFALAIVASFAEVISIGSLLPFLGAITNPEKILNHNTFGPVFVYFGIISPSEVIMTLAIIFAGAVISAGTIRIFLTRKQIQINYQIAIEFSVDIYRHTLYQPYSLHASRNSSSVDEGN